MSDYSFMKTGFNNNLAEQPSIESQIDIETVEILLTVFINNALKNASKYSSMCKRNGVSKEDIIYSLKYEVFEFLNQPDLMDKIEEARNEYLEDIAANEAIEDGDDEDEDDLTDILDDDGNSIVVPDDEIDNFERINNNILDEETEENKEFVRKIHSYYDNWDNWTPTDTIETVLKNAIDKVDI